MKIFILFVLIPIAEILFFINFSQYIGIMLTIFTIFISAIFGFIIIKYQGINTITEISKNFQNRTFNPLKQISHSIIILFSGLLLIFPGFITDLLGIFLLIPQIRNLLIKQLILKMKKKYAFNSKDNATEDIVIDAEFTEIDDKDN